MLESVTMIIPYCPLIASVQALFLLVYLLFCQSAFVWSPWPCPRASVVTYTRKAASGYFRFFWHLGHLKQAKPYSLQVPSVLWTYILAGVCTAVLQHVLHTSVSTSHLRSSASLSAPLPMAKQMECGKNNRFLVTMNDQNVLFTKEDICRHR